MWVAGLDCFLEINPTPPPSPPPLYITACGTE